MHIKKIIIISLVLIFIGIYCKMHMNGKSQQIIIGFMGDVMLARLVNQIIELKGYDYPWGNVLTLVKENDVNIINLETTLTTSKHIIPKVFNFKSNPQHVESLKNAHITVTNLANNHSLDFGTEGLLETIQTLDKAKIYHVGAGKNIEEAKKPVIIEKNGIKIGIIGYTDNEPDWLATDKNPGTNYIEIGNIEKIKHDIRSVRKNVDILIASIHWGPNMKDYPLENHIKFAHEMIDAGIDIIHGHSSHVVQGIELYKNKIIMYDTGDFIDDYAVDPLLRNDLSFLFNIHIEDKKIKEIILLPIHISNMQVNLATTDNRQLIIDLMKKRSQLFGTLFNESDFGLSITSK